MNKKDKKELLEKSVPDLKKELEKIKKSLIEAEFKLSKGQLNNVRLPRRLKNQIAVINTIISQKEKKNE